MRLIHKGIKALNSINYNFEIKLTNYVSILLALFSIPYIFIFYSINRYYGVLVCLIIFVYSVCIVLNVFRWTNVSRFLLIFTFTGGLSFFSIVLGAGLGIQNLFIATSVFPVIICNNREKTLKRLLIMIVFLFVLVTMLLTENQNFNSFLDKILYIFMFLCNISILNLLFTYYVNSFRISMDKLEVSYNDLKESNFQLKESKKREHEAHDQALFGKIIRGIGHEIKNPLAGLKLWSDMLSKSLDDPKMVKQASQVFENNINRLTQRTAIMLKYTGNQKYVLQLFNLNTLLNDLVLLFEHNFKQHDINFEFKDMLQIEVYGSEDLLHSALRNVMLNALQFTPKEGTITLSAKYSNYRDPDETVRHGVGIAISDTGPGIPQDQLTEIFKPFITSHSQSENAGLGLAEVKKAMAYMYGGVDVVSEVGKGTTFYLYVPVEEPVYNGKSLIKPIPEDNR